MLYYAAHMDESHEPPESSRANPDLASYVEGFGRPGDCGVIALDAATGACAGAAWIRRMPTAWPIYRFVDASTPEPAIAVTPAHIGRGMGGLMLARLLGDATAIHSAIVLSGRANNPAKALYGRLGFTTVAELINRVGSTSYIMKVITMRTVHASIRGRAQYLCRLSTQTVSAAAATSSSKTG